MEYLMRNEHLHDVKTPKSFRNIRSLMEDF